MATITINAGDNRNIEVAVTTITGEIVPITGSTVTLAFKNSAGTIVTSVGVVHDVNQATFAVPPTVYNVVEEYTLQLKIVLNGTVRILPADGNYGHLKITRSLFV